MASTSPTPLDVSGSGGYASPSGGDDPNKAFDYLFKIMLVGDSAVGKTCLLMRYTENTFVDTFTSTVGIDFKVKTIVVDGKRVKLQIWDTAGQERFRSITQAYFRGAKGIMLLYDITKQSTFESVRHWIDTVSASTQDSARIMLLGNKVDLEAERQVPTARGEELAREYDISFAEVSVKSNININEAFEALVGEIKDDVDDAISEVTDGAKDSQAQAASYWSQPASPSFSLDTSHQRYQKPAQSQAADANFCGC